MDLTLDGDVLAFIDTAVILDARSLSSLTGAADADATAGPPCAPTAPCRVSGARA
jgi:hypothetical protein